MQKYISSIKAMFSLYCRRTLVSILCQSNFEEAINILMVDEKSVKVFGLFIKIAINEA